MSAASGGSGAAELAGGLDENDALVIFPEGGNFTPERRRRGIERLRGLGLDRMADRAARMTHVLAPRPGGLLAALDAAPDADVVLVAHTGLDHMLTVGDVWRELPMDKVIVMRWWQVPRAEIPAERDAADLARLLLGVTLGIRVLARARPDRALLEGLLRPALALLDAPPSSSPTRSPSPQFPPHGEFRS